MGAIDGPYQRISISDDEGETWSPLSASSHSEWIRLSDGCLIHCDLSKPLDDDERDILRRYLEEVLFPIGEEHG